MPMAAAGHRQQAAPSRRESRIAVGDALRRVPADRLRRSVGRREAPSGRTDPTGVGERVARGIEAARAKHTRRVGRYIFSGLLRCSECGGNYTLLNKRTYRCAGFLNGRICSNNRHVRRETLERVLLADSKTALSSDEVLLEIEHRVRHALRARKPDDDAPGIAKLEAEVDHLVAAIGQGRPPCGSDYRRPRRRSIG